MYMLRTGIVQGYDIHAITVRRPHEPGELMLLGSETFARALPPTSEVHPSIEAEAYAIHEIVRPLASLVCGEAVERGTLALAVYTTDPATIVGALEAAPPDLLSPIVDQWHTVHAHISRGDCTRRDEGQHLLNRIIGRELPFYETPTPATRRLIAITAAYRKSEEMLRQQRRAREQAQSTANPGRLAAYKARNTAAKALLAPKQ
jgi:hypothetical protein